MIGRTCDAPTSAPADPGRWYWCCDGARYNPLLDRARRIAVAQDLDALADQLRAVELAWIHAQLSDEARLALLELHRRRHRELADLEIVTRIDLPRLRRRGRSTRGRLGQDRPAQAPSDR